VQGWKRWAFGSGGGEAWAMLAMNETSPRQVLNKRRTTDRRTCLKEIRSTNARKSLEITRACRLYGLRSTWLDLSYGPRNCAYRRPDSVFSRPFVAEIRYRFYMEYNRDSSNGNVVTWLPGCPSRDSVSQSAVVCTNAQSSKPDRNWITCIADSSVWRMLSFQNLGPSNTD
jgi:hypothetical protein